MTRARWRLAVDTGGTFTDCVARAPDGSVRRVKVLSSGALRAAIAAVDGPKLRIAPAPPDGADLRGFRVRRVGADTGTRAREVLAQRGDALQLDGDLDGAHVGDTVALDCGEEAPLVAARLITGSRAGAPLPPLELRLATTRGTNALLERAGDDVALFITRGFADLLIISDQQRPDIFARRIERAAPLYRDVVEVDERLDAAGAVVRPFDERARQALRSSAGALVQRGVRSAAVALAHAYRDDRHERAVAEILREAGFSHVSCSSQVAPLIKLLDRAETTLVNAYLARVVGGFLDAVARGIGGEGRDDGDGALQVMTSAGGLRRGASYQPKDSLLSGPAGGVVGAADAGARSGFAQVLSFDMGGTSTDVARWAGRPELRYQQRVGDARLRSPMLAIETVAAGGGSICAYQHGELRVGPDSAGADPGPACYGAGGPLTVTDVNLLLGRLSPRRFGVPVQVEAARAALRALQRDIDARAGSGAAARDDEHDEDDDDDAGALCEGLLALADERMADAIRRVSLRRGYDPADHTLVAFGGAGPQHACGVADRLGIDRVIVPADAGLLSAVGLSCAALERVVERQVLAPLDDDPRELTATLREADARARTLLAAELPGDEAITSRALLALRYRGQDSSLDVEVDATQALDAAALRQRFETRHQALFGHRPEGREVEVDSLRVIARGGAAPAIGSEAATSDTPMP
ncbi:MAG: hydantoinase/oxoprolinase family protein, partial [Myxococcales bacterium]|nr:hydantoinase/oxoprolinase family protein [Myxococcales bacterium]